MTIQVLVDWDNNGNYTGIYDDITADVKKAEWRNGMREPYQEMGDENVATLILNNADGKYNPENSSSVLYGNLLPHRRLQIKMDSVVMYTGWIQFPVVQWKVDGAATGQNESRLYGVGAKRFLDKLESNLNLQTSVTGDTIIEALLLQSGLADISTDYTNIDTGLTSIDYIGDAQGQTIYQTITDVTAAERGRFFIGRDGLGYWFNRQRFLQPGAYTSVGTVNTQSGSYKPTNLDYGFGRYLATKVRVSSQQRDVKASENLFELENSITTPASTVKNFEIRLRRSNGQFAAAGSLTPTPSFSSGSASVTITAQGGKASVEIDNSAGLVDAVLSSLTVAGAPTVDTQQVIATAEDLTATSTYGQIEYPLSLGPLSTYSEAESVAQFELGRRVVAQGDVNMLQFLRTANGTDNAHLTTWKIGDRITVTASEIGHDSDYFIIGEEHQWTPGIDGGIHTTTFRLEAALFNTFWLLGVANYSELGISTILGY